MKLLKNRLRLIVRAKRDKKQPEGRCIILFTKAKVLFISHKCKENLHISINLYNFVDKIPTSYIFRTMKHTYFIVFLWLMTLSFFSCVGEGGNNTPNPSIYRPNLNITVPITTTPKLSIDSLLTIPSVPSITPLDSIGDILSTQLPVNKNVTDNMPYYQLLDSFPEDLRTILLRLLKTYPIQEHDSIIMHHYRLLNAAKHTSFRLPEFDLQLSSDLQTPSANQLTELEKQSRARYISIPDSEKDESYTRIQLDEAFANPEEDVNFFINECPSISEHQSMSTDSIITEIKKQLSQVSAPELNYVLENRQ